VAPPLVRELAEAGPRLDEAPAAVDRRDHCQTQLRARPDSRRLDGRRVFSPQGELMGAPSRTGIASKPPAALAAAPA
jgi:hypothetical protein